MDYIVLDFEWNQSSSKTSVKPNMPFEIIEIGAVKLNKERQIVDSYSQFIKPSVYKNLHYKTKELTHISTEDLAGGKPFGEAALDFLMWCGEDYMFCTWGNMDLTELQRNLNWYRLLDLLPGPIKYLNLQKIFRLGYSKSQENSSLEGAVEYFNIKESGDFHRAIKDASYTTQVFQHMDADFALANYTVDFYQYPQSKKEEIHLTYDDYYKYISRGYNDKLEAFSNKEVRATRCYKCGQPAQRQLRWFSAKTKVYYCVAVCKTHGLIRGKIKFKHMDDGKYVAVKTLRLTDAQTARNLFSMKKEVIVKRREKRRKEMEEK